MSGAIADAKAVGDALSEKADFITLNNYYLKSEANTLHTEIKDYVDSEVAALVNSAPETLDTLGELATAFEENKDMVQTLDKAITNKKSITANVTSVGDSLTLSDNTEYRLTNISSLTLSYPEGNFEVWMKILFASSGTISVSFPNETKYIGVAPTFNNGETWEISIKDGVAICWRVEQ